MCVFVCVLCVCSRWGSLRFPLLAALVMKLWDVAWLQLLKKEMIGVLLYCRYVDDCRNFVRPLLEGWRWVDGSFKFSKEWESEDILSGKTDLQRTTTELVKAMNSLIDFIQFEGEENPWKLHL